MVLKELHKNSIKMHSKWFYITVVAYRYYCRFLNAGNWELVKSFVGTKFRRSSVCLHPKVRNRL